MKYQYENATFDSIEDLFSHIYEVNKGRSKSDGGLSYDEGVGLIRATEALAHAVTLLDKRISELEKNKQV